jgi:formylglycine-generating enzyme required for sulfatase activity
MFSMVGILLIVWGFFEATAVNPNYDEYLKHLSMGDSLIIQKEFEPARKAYKKALAYNPKDSAVQKKLDLLNEANRLVEAKEYEAASNKFKVIIEIPAAEGLEGGSKRRRNIFSTPLSPDSNEPLNESDTENNSRNTRRLTLEISINDKGDLVLTVFGGQPFEDSSNPYKINGLDAQQTINWQEKGTQYVATISDWDLNMNEVKVSDKTGMIATKKIDPRETNRLLYKESVAEGDKLFKAGDYSEAIKAYEVALSYKSGDAYCLKQIEKCKEKETIAQIVKSRKSIAAGSFTMGNDQGFSNERPTRTVTLSAFKMMNSEVTVAQYRAFAKANGRSMPAAPAWGWRDNDPMVNISWAEATDFCKWVGGRLPTEAEWEYAAKGGNMSSGFKYSGGNALNAIGWYNSNAGKSPKKIRSLKANELGLYDLTGNVAEWCSDWYGRKYYGEGVSNNPKGPSSGSKKIIRGGNYLSSPNINGEDQLSLSYRNSRAPNTRESWLGFRVAWN